MNEAMALQLSPSRTVVTSFNPRQTPTASVEDYFDDGDWVLCAKSSPSYISCALSNGEIQIFDPRRLHVVQTLRNMHGSNNAMITDLVGPPPQQHADHILVSSGTDGRVCVLDLRQHHHQVATPSASLSLPHSHEQALSVSLGYDGNLAAVGSSKAKIHFYDLRNAQKPVGSYVNSHSNEVTRVRFQHFPSTMSSSSAAAAASSSWLLTGSEDGLACVFDTKQHSEEAALKSVMNAQTPLRQVGFFGPNLEGIYCMTGSETMSLWSWELAQCLADYSDIRSVLNVDYLVNAHWDFGRKELSILAGCNNGDACLSTINVGAATTASSPRPPLATSHRLAGGHRGVVRDWCPVSASLLLTVGEDARMCEWNKTGRQTHAAGGSRVMSGQTAVVRKGFDATNKSSHHPQDATSNVGGGPVRRPQRRNRSVAPY